MKKILCLSLTAVSALALTSCSKLGPLSADNFTVNPTPLEAVAGEVPATINATFPQKYMKKKASITVTPVLKYAGGETTSQPATFQGEKVEGNGTTVQYKAGGNYTMKANFPYTEDMQQSDLYLRFTAKVGKKYVAVPAVKVGYGVLATSDLLRGTVASANPALAADACMAPALDRASASAPGLHRVEAATLSPSLALVPASVDIAQGRAPSLLFQQALVHQHLEVILGRAHGDSAGKLLVLLAGQGAPAGDFGEEALQAPLLQGVAGIVVRGGRAWGVMRACLAGSWAVCPALFAAVCSAVCPGADLPASARTGAGTRVARFRGAC